MLSGTLTPRRCGAVLRLRLGPTATADKAPSMFGIGQLRRREAAAAWGWRPNCTHSLRAELFSPQRVLCFGEVVPLGNRIARPTPDARLFGNRQVPFQGQEDA